MPTEHERGGTAFRWPSSSAVGNVAIIILICAGAVSILAWIWGFDWRWPVSAWVMGAAAFWLAAYMSG